MNVIDKIIEAYFFPHTAGQFLSYVDRFSVSLRILNFRKLVQKSDSFIFPANLRMNIIVVSGCSYICVIAPNSQRGSSTNFFHHLVDNLLHPFFAHIALKKDHDHARQVGGIIILHTS